MKLLYQSRSLLFCDPTLEGKKSQEDGQRDRNIYRETEKNSHLGAGWRGLRKNSPDSIFQTEASSFLVNPNMKHLAETLTHLKLIFVLLNSLHQLDLMGTSNLAASETHTLLSLPYCHTTIVSVKQSTHKASWLSEWLSLLAQN